MKIEIWSLDRIRPYEKNARKIPKRAVDKVAASLLEFGWQQPIVVDKKGVIVVGHVRRLAALQLGWTRGAGHSGGQAHAGAHQSLPANGQSLARRGDLGP